MKAARLLEAVHEAPLIRRMRPRSAVAWRLRRKARYCEDVGSHLYGLLLARAADDVERGGPCWRVLQGHEADDAGSALALRFMGAVHRLVLQGAAPDLSCHYPSTGGDGRAEVAWEPFLLTVEQRREELSRLVNLPVQTNEVGRCSALLGGFLLEARRTRLPLRILELGASAGLNLRWDHYRYESGEDSWGDPSSPLVIDWDVEGKRPPVDMNARVIERRGCDRSPIDPLTGDGRLRLLSYVWADQLARFELLRKACDTARDVPVVVDEADAIDWLDQHLEKRLAGVATVVFHSILMQFLDRKKRARLWSLIESAGREATEDAPLAWLRMETGSWMKEVQLTTWPGRRELVVAKAGLYGRPVNWLVD